MATDVDLATAFAEFSAKGLDKLMTDTKKLGTTMGTATSSMTRAEAAAKAFGKTVATVLSAPGKLLSNVGSQLDSLAKKMQNSPLLKASRALSFGGALGVGGIMAGASRDTVEASQFTAALERLVKVVGDQFAPYMRMATEAINMAATWFKELDSAVAANIAKWALIVTGVAGFVAILPIAIGFLGTIVTALGALLSPIGVVVAGLALAGAAFAGFFDDASSNSDDAASAIEGSQKGWIDSVMGWVQTLGETFGKVWNQVIEWSGKAASAIKSVFGKAIASVEEGLVAILLKTSGMPSWLATSIKVDAQKRRDEAEKPINLDAWKIDIDKLNEKMAGLGDEFKSKITDLNEAFDKIKKAGGEDGFNQKFTAKMEGGGLETFNRLQLGLINAAGADPAKATMKSAQEIATNTAVMAAGIKKIEQNWPPVR